MPGERQRRRETNKLSAGKFHQSGLAPENLTTLAHLAVSSAMKRPNSAGVAAATVPPRSTSRDLNFGSARPALISRLSLSMISAGVPLGAPMPNQALAS